MNIRVFEYIKILFRLQFSSNMKIALNFFCSGKFESVENSRPSKTAGSNFDAPISIHNKTRRNFAAILGKSKNEKYKIK